MPTLSVFIHRKEDLERAELQFGVETGRLAVTLDLLTDALVLAMQHGVYCQSARQSGKPALDIQSIAQNIEHSKELLQSVLERARERPH